MSFEDGKKVLVADDEEGIRFVLAQFLRQEGCEVDLAADGREAIQKAESEPYDLYILDLKMPKIEGLDVLRRIRQLYPEALVVIITAFGSQKLATEALQAGAYDYFTKPFELDELRVILRRALEKQSLISKVRNLENRLVEEALLHRFVGRSEKMERVYELIRRVGGHDITVLITGESGVGKELVAEAIHEIGSGPDRPFVKVNCAAIPETLLESELFGHEKGAFTGAIASKPGKFEVADSGSILLDEIGEMPLALQAKLLRVIQEKQVERIGDNRSRPIHVRIMAATNQDLGEMVRKRTFREDLFFRINVVPIFVPPLRERLEDIAPLIEFFIKKYTNRNGKKITAISPEAIQLLEAYPWPGNVRELENTIQRAIVMNSGPVLDISSLPAAISGREIVQSRLVQGRADQAGVAGNLEEAGPMAPKIERIVEEAEKKMIVAALQKMNFRRQESADLLGISRKSLHNKMHKYGLLKSRDRDDREESGEE
ncbi:sigma-54-dependent Fis family transcriptional regulator [Candidatus Sumerlaeota bacterium]|nr:sigma-54-dependent Fis family transcriptional regulator [Candidatus Sumerlaeota bacterium]